MSAIRKASDTDTGPITPVYALPIDHPSAWKPADFASPADYTIELTASRSVPRVSRLVTAASISSPARTARSASSSWARG